MPIPGAYGEDGFVIAKTKTSNYYATEESYLKMYDDLGLSNAKRLYIRMREASVLWSMDFPCPLSSGTIHVMWSTYGDDEFTPRGVEFEEDFHDDGSDPGNPIQKFGCSGDGTVPKSSLERFTEWEDKKIEGTLRIQNTHFDNVEHKAMVGDPVVLTKIVKVLSDSLD